MNNPIFNMILTVKNCIKYYLMSLVSTCITTNIFAHLVLIVLVYIVAQLFHI